MTLPTSDRQEPEYLILDDGLGRRGCVNTAACRCAVGILRGETTHPLPAKNRVLSADARAAGIDAAGVLDLDSYPSFDAVMEHVRTMTEKLGRVNREVARARRLGYYAKEFAFGLHVPDLVAIHHSKQVRDGRPIESSFYKRGIDELGGAPTSQVTIQPKACPQHSIEYWGIFRRVPGHAQGTVTTDEQLVGYIGLDRWGDSLWYSSFMGHGDFLRDGIMYLLHYALVAKLLQHRPDGLRYLIYYPYARRLNDRSTHWKQLALFKPHYLLSVDEHRLAIPSPGHMPSMALALVALKTIPFTHWPTQDESLGVSPAWIAFLHRAQAVEIMRAPKLLTNVLWSRPHPPLETLRPLASGLFPVEALAGVRSTCVLLQGKDRGLEALLPVHDLGVQSVDVFHPDPAELTLLQATYPAAWRYNALAAAEQFAEAAASADLAVIEQPLADSIEFLKQRLAPLLKDVRGPLLVGIDEAMLDFLRSTYRDDERIARGFSAFLGPVSCRGTFFRYRYPTREHWVWLERS